MSSTDGDDHIRLSNEILESRRRTRTTMTSSLSPMRTSGSGTSYSGERKEPSERSSGRVVDLVFCSSVACRHLSCPGPSLLSGSHWKVPAVIETVVPLGRTNIRQRKTSWTSHHSSLASQ